VLGWNRTGHALFAGHLGPYSPAHPGQRPNTARLVFRDPHTRELYEDWPKKARDVVGKLRLAVGQHPDDPRLAALIGELAMKSAEFTTMWSEHRVRKWDLATYRMHHPLVGRMQLNLQTLNVPQEEGQRIVVATADAGTTSAAALCLLAQTSVPTAIPTTRQAGRTEAPGSSRDGADSRS
jgi:MmyB-like transcription regulator ligand binding domain